MTIFIRKACNTLLKTIITVKQDNNTFDPKRKNLFEFQPNYPNSTF